MEEAKLMIVLEELQAALDDVVRRFAVEAAVSNGLALVLARAGLVTPQIADVIRHAALPSIKDDELRAALETRVEGLAGLVRAAQDERAFGRRPDG